MTKNIFGKITLVRPTLVFFVFGLRESPGKIFFVEYRQFFELALIANIYDTLY